MTETFLTLELPYDRSKAKQEPLIISVDQIEAVSPREYSDGGISPRHGSVIRTRSGAEFVVTQTPSMIEKFLKDFLEGK